MPRLKNHRNRNVNSFLPVVASQVPLAARGSAGDQVHSCSRELRARIPRLRSKSKANSRKSAHNAVAKVNVKLESKPKTMKAKHLFLATAALLAAGGLWLAWSAWRTHTFQESSMGVGLKTPRGPHFDPNSAASLPRASQTGPTPATNNRPKPGQMLRPPDPNRRFTDFTPEQRVQFARQGHGPGG